MIEKQVNDTDSGWTATDLAERFGSIPIRRVCMDPPPGAATEADVVRLNDQTDRLYELVDGTLLEKTMGTYESFLAILIATRLANFADEGKLGIVLGADGMLRMAPGLIRIPDVSFISRGRLPNGFADQGIASIVPDLAVEIISPGNSQQEMDRKVEEYFQCGVQLVWYVYPRDRSVHVFTNRQQSMVLSEEDTLDAGSIVPGFTLSIRELFAKP